MDLAHSFGLAPVDASGRDGDGNPLLQEGEEIMETFHDVQLVLGADSDQKSGKLFITDGRIFWLSSGDPSLGFSAEFAAISMHAVATDPDSVDRPCLYIQMDTGDEGGDLDAGSDDEAPPFPELRLIPADPAALDPLFDAFCAGAERNPDPDAAEEGQGSLFFDAGEALAGALEAAEVAGDVEALAGDDHDRFGDADEVQENGKA